MTYTIRYSKVRDQRGLKPWAVFEQIEEGFARAVSDHQTEDEAKAAKAALEKEASK